MIKVAVLVESLVVWLLILCLGIWFINKIWKKYFKQKSNVESIEEQYQQVLSDLEHDVDEIKKRKKELTDRGDQLDGFVKKVKRNHQETHGEKDET